MKEPIRELRCHYLVTCVYNNTIYFYCEVIQYQKTFRHDYGDHLNLIRLLNAEIRIIVGQTHFRSFM